MRVAALVLVAACAHRGAPRPRFDVGAPGDGWDRVAAGGADRAWYHPGISATIYADANCAARYEDGDLGDLLAHLTHGIARGAPLEERAFTLDGRDALQRAWAGEIDGVSVRIAATVVKKNDCLYDFLYFAPPSRFAEGWTAYEGVLGGFRARG